MQATNKSDATQVYESAVKSSRTGAKGTLKYILKPLTIFGYHYFIEGIRAVQKDGPTKELEKITNLSYEETIKVMEKCQQDGVRVVATERTLSKENSEFGKKKSLYQQKKITKYARRMKHLSNFKSDHPKVAKILQMETFIKRNEAKQKEEQIKHKDRHYKVYEYAKSYKEQDPKYMMPKEVEIFLNLQKELQISSVEEARNLIKSTRQERIGINKRKKEILDLQRELNHLDTIKEEKLIQSGLYIHNIKFGGNHIDYKKSNNDNYCIILPYTKEKMYIPKKYTAFNEKYQYYTLFLVDDKKYELFDENDNKIQDITGRDLEEHVLEKKKEIDKLYSY